MRKEELSVEASIHRGVAHLHGVQGALGSKLGTPTTCPPPLPGESTCLQAGGQGFESPR